MTKEQIKLLNLYSQHKYGVNFSEIVNFGFLDFFKKNKDKKPKEKVKSKKTEKSKTKQTDEEIMEELKAKSKKEGYAKSDDGNFVFINGAIFIYAPKYNVYWVRIEEGNGGIHIRWFNATCDLKKIAKIYTPLNQDRFFNSFENKQPWVLAFVNSQLPELRKENLRIGNNLFNAPDLEIRDIEIREDSLHMNLINHTLLGNGCYLGCEMKFPQHTIKVGLPLRSFNDFVFQIIKV